jgi:hypothetical protein
MRELRKLQSGYLIVGALISVVILVMVVMSLFSTISFITIRTERSRLDTEASLILQEGIEVVYNVFLNDWADYTEGDYYPAVAFGGGGGKWILLPGKEDKVRAGFTRWLEVENVCRTGAGKNGGMIIGCESGETDLNSRVVKGVVEWKEKGEEKRIETELLLIRGLEG